MPSNYDRLSTRNENPLIYHIGLSLLRIGAGFTLFYAEGWNLAHQVWQHLWNSAHWPFIDTLTNAELPLPKVLAITIAITIALCSVAWILGFVTRFASTIMLPITAICILIANRTGLGPTSSEAAALYFFIALCLLITGPGFCSVDALFSLRRKKKSLYV